MLLVHTRHMHQSAGSDVLIHRCVPQQHVGGYKNRLAKLQQQKAMHTQNQSNTSEESTDTYTRFLLYTVGGSEKDRFEDVTQQSVYGSG